MILLLVLILAFLAFPPLLMAGLTHLIRRMVAGNGHREALAEAARTCQHCGYSLDGLDPATVCPECGSSRPKSPWGGGAICRGCGYSLSGLDDNAQCPECGVYRAELRAKATFRIEDETPVFLLSLLMHLTAIVILVVAGWTGGILLACLLCGVPVLMAHGGLSLWYYSWLRKSCTPGFSNWVGLAFLAGGSLGEFGMAGVFATSSNSEVVHAFFVAYVEELSGCLALVVVLGYLCWLWVTRGAQEFDKWRVEDTPSGRV